MWYATCTHSSYDPLSCVAKCIDKYAEMCARSFDEGSEDFIDPRLRSVVDRMFERCFADKEYKQAVGIALETRRMDVLQRAIRESVSLNCTSCV